MKEKYYIDKKRYDAAKKRLSVSDKQVAEAIGISSRTVQGYVEKNPRRISADRLEEIAYYLSVSAKWLAGEKDERFNETGARIEIFEQSAVDHLTEYLMKKGYIKKFTTQENLYTINGKEFITSDREKDFQIVAGFLTIETYKRAMEKAIEDATNQFIVAGVYYSQDRRKNLNLE